MAELFDRLVAFYDEAGWPMVQVPNETILSTTYQGERGQWVFVSSCHEEHGTVTMFSRGPAPAPPERHDELLRLFNQVNFGLTHGAWVLDPTDGEIRFRVGADLRGGTPSDEALQRMTLFTVLTMDQAIPALEALLAGKVDAAGAFQMLFDSAP